jgi:hypothetical protein
LNGLDSIAFCNDRSVLRLRFSSASEVKSIFSHRFSFPYSVRCGGRYSFTAPAGTEPASYSGMLFGDSPRVVPPTYASQRCLQRHTRPCDKTNIELNRPICRRVGTMERTGWRQLEREQRRSVKNRTREGVRVASNLGPRILDRSRLTGKPHEMGSVSTIG